MATLRSPRPDIVVTSAGRARRAASVLAWLLVAFAVITGFSIGLFVLQAAIALVAAAALTPLT